MIKKWILKYTEFAEFTDTLRPIGLKTILLSHSLTDLVKQRLNLYKM